MDIDALGTLIMTLAQSPVLATIVNAVSSWLGLRHKRTVKLDADGEVLLLEVIAAVFALAAVSVRSTTFRPATATARGR